MRILGLDVGDRRIGVALSDPMRILAKPLAVITVKSGVDPLAEILSLAREHEVSQIIVGLPRSMDGSIGEQAVKTKDFADKLSEQTSIPIEFSDERLSTAEADRILKSKKKSPQEIKKERDAYAAALILQWYLDEHAPKESF